MATSSSAASLPPRSLKASEPRCALFLSALLFVIIFALASPLVAQSQSAKSPPVPKPRDEVRIALERQTFADARSKSKVGDHSAAEQSLRALNRGTPGTPGWHRHQAQLLLELATQMRSDARPGAISSLATAALVQAEAADRLAQTPIAHAAAKSMAGYIYERYLGDLPNALRSYQAASALMPKDQSWKDAVTRLQRASAAFPANKIKGRS